MDITGQEKLIAKRDWDILILLDALRYDYFEKYSKIDGNLRRVITPGSCTEEWRQKIFNYANYKDTAYVSGNPQVSEWKFLRDTNEIPFFHIDEVWKYGWNEKYKCVIPEEVTNSAIKNIDTFRDKHMIIHYLQPHPPFITNDKYLVGRGQEWEKIEAEKHTTIPIEQVKYMGGLIYNYIGTIFNTEDIRTGYKDNLLLVLQEAEILLDYIELGEEPKKVIISSDHGERLGYQEDNYTFGHGVNLTGDIRKIPWFEVEL